MSEILERTEKMLMINKIRQSMDAIEHWEGKIRKYKNEQCFDDAVALEVLVRDEKVYLESLLDRVEVK